MTGTESRSGKWVFVPLQQHPIPSRGSDFRFPRHPPAADAQTRQLLRSTTESVRCRTGATRLYKSCPRPGMQTFKNEGWISIFGDPGKIQFLGHSHKHSRGGKATKSKRDHGLLAATRNHNFLAVERFLALNGITTVLNVNRLFSS